MQFRSRIPPVLPACLLILGAGCSWLLCGPSSLAFDSPPTADAVAREWRHPQAAAKNYRITLDRSRVVGDMFLVDKPYKDVWEHYAQKCGHRQSFPESVPIMSTGSRSYLILHERRTGQGEPTLSSSFTYQTTQNVIQVTLASRDDGVEVFLSVVTR